MLVRRLSYRGPTAKGENQLFDEMKENVQRLYNSQRNLVTKLLAEAKQILGGDNVSDDDQKKGRRIFAASTSRAAKKQCAD